jgi:hypothetical protein
VKSALEAAHITPYLGPHTNHPSNGLLLRADIHTLWDLGLIAINPQNMQIVIGPELKGSEYEIYQNQMPKINLQHNQLSEKALYQQFELLKSEENHHG